MTFPAASATLQLRLSVIRLWYDFLLYQDICSLNPLPCAGLHGVIYTWRGLVPRITRLPVIPDDEQWLKFLKHVSTASLRDRLMLALAYFGALRRAEVTALALEDIDPAHRLIRIRPETTKSRRERIICYGPDVTPVLANHFRQLKQAGWTQGSAHHTNFFQRSMRVLYSAHNDTLCRLLKFFQCRCGFLENFIGKTTFADCTCHNKGTNQ
ncbi:site-specific integrase [Pantoea agglomerans]|uniref:site-specific integrase n=1 Tax=Enterobacter agglomerans TaxID=549 RepID=UPI001FCEC312|nr:tyrosine-type recombinase/integrase [Pantoea agglomerans]WVL83561.1 tyrosine-type recombinase/integrase [Pantoea agglomerans]